MVRVLDEEVRYKGAVYDSTRKKIELDNGRVIVRDVISKPECVVAIVQHVDSNELILVKEFRVGSMSEEYGFPAGFIDKGETPMMAIIREVQEETGYSPVTVEYLGKTMTSSGFTDEKIHHFYVEVSGAQNALMLDHDENIEVVKFKFSSLDEMIQNGHLNSNHSHACYLKLLQKYNGINKLQ